MNENAIPTYLTGVAEPEPTIHNEPAIPIAGTHYSKDGTGCRSS